jgi:hypothetical protein
MPQLDWPTEIARKPAEDPRNYDFAALAPGGSLTVGSNTITFPRGLPPGINANSPNVLRLYLSGGVGTAEAVTVTAVDTAASQVTIICAYTHTGAWTIASATGGVQEAICQLPSSGGVVLAPAETISLHAPIKRRFGVPLWVQGAGRQATIFAIAADFDLSAKGVFDWSPGDGLGTTEGGISDFTVLFSQPTNQGSSIASYTHWPPAFYANGNYHPTVERVDVIQGWTGFMLDGNNNGATFQDLRASCFHRMFDLETTGHCYDDVFVEGCIASTLGLQGDQFTAWLTQSNDITFLSAGSIDGLHVTACSMSIKFGTFNTGSDGDACAAIIMSTWMDMGGVAVFDGAITIMGCQILPTASVVGISHLKGQVRVMACEFDGSGRAYLMQAAGTTTAVPFVRASLVDCDFYSTADAIAVQAIGVSPYSGTATLRIHACGFYRATNTNYSTQSVLVQNGTATVRASICGNMWSDIGTGYSIQIQAIDNVDHVIAANDGGGGAGAIVGAKTAWGADNVRFTGVTAQYPNSMTAGAVGTAAVTAGQTENYIASETGANNAIAGALTDPAGTAVALAAALKVTVKLAHTLQAGANTFALNGGAAKSIKSSRNASNNIGTAYAAGGVIALVYDGTQWLDLSQ